MIQFSKKATEALENAVSLSRKIINKQLNKEDYEDEANMYADAGYELAEFILRFNYHYNNNSEKGKL